ncbi:AI-2E family transporter [Slackia heliotrinireducens]|uniref:AI-2E family transporter n=1 Tax=Slackia heliotrinireducens TaxID=84110 RepID=UPI003315FAC0
MEELQREEELKKTEKAKRTFYRAWGIIGIVVIVAGIGYVLRILSTPLSIVMWATLFVFILRSPVAFFESKGIPRVWGTAISYIVMFAVLSVLVAIMFSPTDGIGEQAENFIASIPGWATNVADWINANYDQYAHMFDETTVREWLDSFLSSMSAWANELASASATSILDFTSGLANSLMIIIFGLIVAFWILMELPAMGREFRRMVPDRFSDDVEMLYLTVTQAMGGYVRATLVVCLSIGVACGLVFGIASVPNAAVLALIAAVLNVIPVVGHWIGLFLVTGIALFSGPITAVIVFVSTLIIQEIVYMLIQPKLMSNSVDVHPALVIVAMFIGSSAGTALAGIVGSIVGMLISIPVAAILKSLFVYYYERGTDRQLVSEDGVFFKGTPQHDQADDTKPDAMADAVAPVHRAEASVTSSFVPWFTGRMPVDLSYDGEESEEPHASAGLTGKLTERIRGRHAADTQNADDSGLDIHVTDAQIVDEERRNRHTGR